MCELLEKHSKKPDYNASLIEADGSDKLDFIKNLQRKARERNAAATDATAAAPADATTTAAATPATATDKPKVSPKETLAAVLSKYGKKANPQDVVASAPKTQVEPEAAPAPAEFPASDPLSNVGFSQKEPEQTEEPESPESRTRSFADDPAIKARLANYLSDKLHGTATGRHGAKAKSFGFNDGLRTNLAHRFFTRVGLETLKLPYKLLDYTQGGREPQDRGAKLPPAGQEFRILFGRMQRDSTSPDYEIIMDPIDFGQLNKFVSSQLGGRERDEGGMEESLLTHLLKPALASSDMDGLIFRAAQFENFMRHPKVKGKVMTMDALADELASLAGPASGGLGPKIDDVEALAYLIKTAKANGFDYFRVQGNLQDPSSSVKIVSDQELGATSGDIDRADTRTFQRGLFKSKDTLDKLRRGTPLFGKENQQESSKIDQTQDLMDLMEYWNF